MGLTERLADFALGTTLEDLPDPVVRLSRDMMLNGLAVAVGALGLDEAAIVTRLAERFGGEATCTVLGTPIRTAPAAAALANGTLVHLLDFDEVVLRRANHPTNVLLPTVLAMAESLHRSGREALEAFAIGCEISTKLGAIGDLDEVETRLDHNGWHVEGVAGAIAAAVAAGRLRRLDVDALRNAIGVAVSSASGVQANFGTSTKSLHCGLAAMHGVLAADLAAAGFTANPDSLEVQGGFLDCYRRDREVDADVFIARLGNPYDVIDPGVGLKFYPCGSALHTAIDLTVELVQGNGLRAEDVTGIHVSWPGLPRDKLAGFGAPATGLEAKFSLPYTVAVAAVHGAPTLADFRDDAVRDPALVGMMGRITASTDEVATRDASRPATVTVTLADGRVLRAHADHALGHPSHPMSRAQLDAKFRSCASGRFTEAEMDRIIQAVRSIEDVDDMAELTAEFRR